MQKLYYKRRLSRTSTLSYLYGSYKTHILKPMEASEISLKDIQVKKFEGKVESRSNMPVGGSEGKKTIITIENPRYEPGRTDVSPELTFISKRYYTKEKALGVVEYTDKLRSLGFPVPPTTRYYEENGEPNIMMTDMSEGGKNIIWGGNGSADPEEAIALQSMNLTKIDLQNIERQVRDIFKKAVQNSVRIYGDNYHLSKSRETGEVKVILIDIRKPPDYEMNLKSPYELRDMRLTNAGFIEDLWKTVRPADLHLVPPESMETK